MFGKIVFIYGYLDGGNDYVDLWKGFRNVFKILSNF